jgi:DNA polymerase III psi subunit
MIEARRRAYLDALGFDVWVARAPSAVPGQPERLAVGPGGGATLLVCDSAADCDTELARDLARALGGDPAWAWLEPLPNDGGQALADIISGRLATRVLLFGAAAARRLFHGDVPEILGSAALTVLPSLRELAASGRARQSLWRHLRGLCVAGGAVSR